MPEKKSDQGLGVYCLESEASTYIQVQEEHQGKTLASESLLVFLHILLWILTSLHSKAGPSCEGASALRPQKFIGFARGAEEGGGCAIPQPSAGLGGWVEGSQLCPSRTIQLLGPMKAPSGLSGSVHGQPSPVFPFA